MIMFVLLAIRCSLVDHHLKGGVTPSVAGMTANRATSARTPCSRRSSTVSSNSPRPSPANVPQRSSTWYVQSPFSQPLIIYRFHDASQRTRLTDQLRPTFYATHGSRRMISADSNRLNQTYPLPHFKMRSLRAHNSVVT